MRIAVIRFSSFGDILNTGPAVRGIRAAFPDAEITYITNPPYADVAAALPGVDRVHTIRRRGEGFERDVDALEVLEPFDKVADLQGSPKSNRVAQDLGTEDVRVDRPPRLRRTLLLTTRLRIGTFRPVALRMMQTLAPWGVKDDGGSLRITVPPDARTRVERAWNGDLAGGYVLVPGAKHPTKQWPGAHWAHLVEQLPKDAPVVVIGGTGETPGELAQVLEGRDNAFDLTGRTDMLEAAAVLEQARVVVTGDTGPMHLAVSVGAPLVAMFGPTVREFGFFPFRADPVAVLERDLWCRPCSAHGSPRCPLGHHKCLVEITPEQVAEAVAQVERRGEQAQASRGR